MVGRESIVRYLKISTILLAVFANITAVYADGYQGDGGGATQGCDSSNNMYSYQNGYGACEYSGFGWTYFAYEPGFNGDLWFIPASNGSGGIRRISSECVRYGGFWHFGYFQYKQYTMSYGDTKVNYYGFGSTGNPSMSGAGSSFNLDKNYETVRNSGQIYGGQTFYVNGVKAAHSETTAHSSKVKEYYENYRKDTPGVPNNWGKSLNYFCSGRPGDNDFQGRIKSATVNGKSASNNSTINISGDEATVTFNNQMKRGGQNSSLSAFWKIDNGGIESMLLPDNNGWRTVSNVTKTVEVDAGGSTIVYEDMDYAPKVSDNNQISGGMVDVPQNCTLSGAQANGRYCIKLTRNAPKTSGLVDVQVTTDSSGGTITNPGGSVSSSNGRYTVKFQHSVKRYNDGAGGTVSISYNTFANGSSNRGSISEGHGSNHSGSTRVSEGNTKVVVSYPEEVITGTLFPGESREFCQNLSYTYRTKHTYYDSKGKKHTYYEYHSGSGSRCATVTRSANVQCDIDGAWYGIDNGKNTARMIFKNATNGQSKTLIGSGNDHIWAKPTDRIRYDYDVCAAGQLHDDYYHWGSSSYNSPYVFTGGNTTSSNPYKYLFPSQLGNGTQPYTVPFGYGSHSWGGEGQYEKSFASPTVNTLGCASANPGKYYQIPDHKSLNCKSRDYVGRDSDAGSIISQKLDYPSKPNGGTSTLKGDVYVPYNYDLNLRPSNSDNPKDVPVNADTTYSIKYNIDVTNRCNAQVQGSSCEGGAYHTKPKTTQYRIYTWVVDTPSYDYVNDYNKTQVDNSIASIKNSIGTPIKDTSGKVIGYYMPRDPAQDRRYTINASGPDLFKGDGDAATISGNVTVPHNTEIGAKVCTALAVWPADSHDLPGGGNINTNDQSVALKDGSNGGWRSTEPNCYSVGKKPNFAVKNGMFISYGGVSASTFTRKPDGNTPLIFGAWSEYSTTSSKKIVGFSSGAAVWGGASYVADSNVRTCKFATMTLANADCSAGDLGNLAAYDKSRSSSAASVLDQIMTRYTAKVDSEGNAIDDLGNAEVDFGGICRYYEERGIYLKDGGEHGNYACLRNGSSYQYSSGTLTFTDDISSSDRNGITRVWHIAPATDKFMSRTRVVKAKKIIINRDIRYGNSDLETDHEAHSKTIFKSAADTPQILLIADEIIIGESVRNIDAWLIADKIDTCGVKYNANANIPVNDKYLSSRTCNKQLHVNGPVFTKYLKLNRTYGAGGDGQWHKQYNSKDSYWTYRIKNGGNNPNGQNVAQVNDKYAIAAPAEVFSISPEVYMWAMSEGTRFSQATVTYQRELPPRY